MIPEALRPEERLLLQCARAQVEPDQREAIRVLVDSPLDWEYVITTARRHRILPLVHWSLKELKERSAQMIPPPILDKIRTAFFENTRFSLLMLSELKALLSLLNGHHIPVIPYKGIMLALQAYDHNALRMSRDIDLVVQHQDIHNAIEILLRNGYHVHHDYEGSDHNRQFEQLSHAFSLVNSTNGLQIELHWRFMPGVSIDTSYFWHKAVSTAFNGGEVLQFAPADLILLLLIHGSKHLWSELIWAVDVDRLLRRIGEIHWDQLLVLSQDWGVGRFLRVGIMFCHALLSSPVPKWVLTKCGQDQTAVRLSGAAQQRLFRSQGTSSLNKLAEYRSDFQMRDTWNGKVRYLQALMTTWKPSPRDTAFLRLPRRLSFLYPVVRPLRVLIEYGTDIVRSRLR